MRIAVLGGGVMGETLAAAFLKGSPTPEVVVVEKRAERARELAEILGVRVAGAEEAIAGADVVVLVVKPQDTAALLSTVGGMVEPGSVVVSIAAGIPTSLIESAVPAGVNVVRAMPNTPARIGQGVTGISAGAHCSAEALATVEGLLAPVGLVVTVPEELQDAVTAVSGSGPAYLFYLAEAMVQAAESLGLESRAATAMVTQTLLGAAMLLDATGEPAGELRAKVTSPGGTTAAATAVLDERAVTDHVIAALTAARDRGRALAGG